MKMNDVDIGLKTFLNTAKKTALDLEEDFLIKIYEIQKKYIYDHQHNQEISMRETEKLVEEYVDKVHKGSK
jgi:hypothetical protein